MLPYTLKYQFILYMFYLISRYYAAHSVAKKYYDEEVIIKYERGISTKLINQCMSMRINCFCGGFFKERIIICGYNYDDFRSYI